MRLRAALLISVLSFAAVSARSFADSPKNTLIDLTIPLSAEPATDAEVFDESVIFAPNFGVDQNDPALSDLFDEFGESELCFPTALTEALIYLKGFSTPKFDQLQLAGISANGQSIDPNALIRQLVPLCKTDEDDGTDDGDGLNCALSLLSTSHYGVGKTQLISPFDATMLAQNPSLPIANRAITIADLRTSLSNRVPVILEVGWYSFNAKTKAWDRDSGHFVGVYGYDYNNWWGENQIQLKVVNPETQYDNTRKSAQFDTITIIKPDPQPGIIYPADRPFIATGAGFGGETLRGFVGSMLTVDPQVLPALQ